MHRRALNILNGSVSAFTRDLGIEALLTEVIRKHMWSFEEAEQMQFSDSGEFPPARPTKQTDAVMSHDVLEAMENVANEISDQLNRSMEFYGATHPILARVISTSAVGVLRLLERTIINRLGIGVTVIDLFNRIGLVDTITVHVSPRLLQQPPWLLDLH